MMTGLVFLADSLDITNRHINASASQHIQPDGNLAFAIDIDQFRSEERRVGKECRSRWSPYH